MAGAAPTLLEISTIARTIQLSVAPVFLLAGIGSILNVLAGRLSRVVDRARTLERWHGESKGAEHDRHVWELRLLDRRISLVSTAIGLCVASAIAVCVVVALLFVAELAALDYARSVAIIFVAAMALLVIGLALFLIEVRIAIRAIHVRAELLEQARR